MRNKTGTAAGLLTGILGLFMLRIILGTTIELTIQPTGCYPPSNCFVRSVQMQTVIWDVANYYTSTLDMNGQSNIEIPEDNVPIWWWVKPEGILAQAARDTAACPPCEFPIGFLGVNGDVNNDNVIDISDYILFRNAYGTSIGGPNYLLQADLNRDDRINAQDFVILHNSFGMEGAPQW